MKPTLLLSALLGLTATGGEHTVQSEAFETSISVEARLLPTTATLFQLEPEQWSNFVIKEVVDHGTVVKKGDPLIVFDSEDFDKALAEAIEAAESRKINLETAKRELDDLELSTPLKLQGEEAKFVRTRESFEYFMKTGKALELEKARMQLLSAEQSVENVKEELAQLLKMYEEDGVTEETEEIILKRQRSAVERAEFSLKATKLAVEWDQKNTIPQKATDLKRELEEARIAYETAKLSLKNNLALKKLSVAKAERDDAEADKKLAELETDKALFSINAPADGMIYHGEIKDGVWSLGNTPKFLFEKGSVPANTVFMTLVPTASPFALFAGLNQEQRLKLPTDASGTAEVSGLDDSEYPVTVTSVDLAPGGDNQYQLAMKITLPEEAPIVSGMSAKVKLITYRNEEALVVPTQAVTTKDGKSTVKVKMADGKDEVREVKTGHRSDDKIEILEGLTADQVVLLPDPE